MNTVNKKEIQEFIKSWSQGAHEVADKVTFWNAILKFLGVPQQEIDNRSFIDYEKTIKLKKNEHFDGSIDAYIPSTHVLIEQKSTGVDLNKKERRPNGGNDELITPYQQARRYDNHLSANEHAYFYVLCNFDEFIIYDIRESVDTKPITIKLKELDKKLESLDFLVNQHEARLQQEKQVSIDAGKLVSKMYDELLKIFSNYPNLDDQQVKHSINELCVRLVFCLYAEDANLFKSKSFYNYLKDVEPAQIGLKLKELFKILNTKEEERGKGDAFWSTEHPKLSKFPYCNGGLFANENIIIPPFTPELKHILLDEASEGFNWSAISPTIFGAVFESTLNPETRRQGGMHYTSVKNIHKVIDPLFLNELRNELEQIKAWKQPKKKQELAKAFQMKLSHLTFFDPACGSGNFLTETYLSLRKLENEALKIQYPNPLLDTGDSSKYIKVSIQQFFGIEINDFAVSVAKTALWIAESQMMEETKDIFYANWQFLPLKTYTHIHEGNALKMDWNKVIEAYGCHFIMGNPPFLGYTQQNKEQKADLEPLFGKTHNIDYVAGWYAKACDYIKGTNAQVAFVSTNSITQGEQVLSIWQNLMTKYDITINFAYRTFKWNSEATQKAHVHVVIISFSNKKSQKQDKCIYDGTKIIKAKHINPYLIAMEDVFIEKHRTPLNAENKITKGSSPTDHGYLLLNKNEANELIAKNPTIKKYVRPFIDAHDFLNNKIRYCLWLTDAQPNEIRKFKFIYDRLQKIHDFRLQSTKKATRDIASTPWLFQEIRQPSSNYLLIPSVTSGRRTYVPMGYFSPNVIASSASLIVPNATIYTFGVLESIVHTSWIRTVAGRLKSDYRYSAQIVYNSFPWPNINDKQKQKIEETAQAILDARAKYPDSSLADLYDPLTMPADLLKAHKANDKAVFEAYNLKANVNASDIVAHLFKMYEDLTK